MFDTIKKTIESAVEEAEVLVLDPRNDGKHLEAIVISDRFEGQLPLQRQRPIMSALKGCFADFLHALALHTYTQKEWNDYGKSKHITQ